MGSDRLDLKRQVELVAMCKGAGQEIATFFRHFHGP
jgi:hypothetical protein